MRSKHFSRCVWLAMLGSAGSAWAGPDCGSCSLVLQRLTENESARVRYHEFLVKNREVMAKLSPDESSKRIKYSSNILVTTIHLETVETNIRAINVSLQQKGCAKCPSIERLRVIGN